MGKVRNQSDLFLSRKSIQGDGEEAGSGRGVVFWTDLVLGGGEYNPQTGPGASKSNRPRDVFRVGAHGQPASPARRVIFRSAVRQEEVF